MLEATDRGPVSRPRGEGRLADLFPGYFALVMATGIIAVGAVEQGIRWLAWALLWVDAGFYVVLWALYLLRLVRYPARFLDDLTGHQRGPSYLTMVAGTNVLGSGFVVIAGWRTVGIVLWILGIALWVVLLYTVVAALTLREPKPDLASGLNGGWLLMVVGTESVGVLAALLARGASRADVLLFVAFVACMIGLLLYVVVIGLVCYRWWFFRMASEQATPPYWINMGALAISTLACATIYAGRQAAPAVAALGPFLGGMTVLFWAGATWWIPFLVVIGVWRHLVQRVPVRYDPQYWSLVFPLGMYGVATFRMAAGLRLDFLDWVPKGFLAIALLAWALTLVGMGRLLLRPVLASVLRRAPS
ncbi:MAG TPA: tellurite resistance/C4-dicarboxylate transporter family protein [Actinomycetota bacterium]|jgi:tellurite resistance protein TehA-like permease|nr:tellurite resistance/C4-dicarboxylate transporter family protein [Actinomycetota bacterium]